MIDDLRYIHEKDKSDALGLAVKQCQQIGADFAITPELKTDHAYNVVFAGMGGSALSALLARTWPVIKEPFEVVRDYKLPEYVDGDTLFIASSYSGNTEEEIACLEEAEKKGAQIVVMSSGGQLADIAAEKKFSYVRLPVVSQPHQATFLAFSLKLIFHL